jgi:hypothetical protein
VERALRVKTRIWIPAFPGSDEVVEVIWSMRWVAFLSSFREGRIAAAGEDAVLDPRFHADDERGSCAGLSPLLVIPAKAGIQW